MSGKSSGAMPLVGASNAPPQFYSQSATAGLIPGLGAYQFAGPQQITPGWNPANIQGGPLPGQGAGGGAPVPTPMPGSVLEPSGGYAVPTNPQYVDPNKVPVGGVGPAPPGPPLTGITSVPPAGFTPSQTGATTPTPSAPITSSNGGAINKTPLDSNNKAALAGGNVAGAANAYANQYLQGIQNDPALMHAIANGRMSGIASQLAQMPASFTPQQVSAAMQSNPAAAFQMLSAGGGNLQNAVMQNNGMTPQQMAQFINNAGYNQGGLTYRG